MKTKFINGVSSSPSLSLGLLVTENALQVQPDTEDDCKEIIRPDQPDLETKQKAWSWCREFLHGAWKTVSVDDFQITIIRYSETYILCLFLMPQQIKKAICMDPYSGASSLDRLNAVRVGLFGFRDSLG